MCCKFFKNNRNGFLTEQKVYQQEAVFGDYHLFRKFEIYIFVAESFSYDNRRYLEDKFCFYG